MVVSMMRTRSDHKASAGLLCSLALLLLVFTGVPSADAQSPSAQPPPPPQVQQFLNLLQDPAVRGSVDQQQASPAPPPRVQQFLNLFQDPAVRGWTAQQQAPPSPPLVGPPPMASEMTGSEMMAARTASLREHLASLAAAAPHLPSEFRNAADRLLA